MGPYKHTRGVPGALECVCCFERDCFGCVLTATHIGVCPVCGRDVGLGDAYEWREKGLVHWDCLGKFEGDEENDALRTGPARR